MNDERPHVDSFQELPSSLQAAIDLLKQKPVPVAAMRRALDRAARGGAPVRPAPHRLWAKTLWGLAAAVAVCLAAALWFSRPSIVWADVVAAVQAKPWIRVTRKSTLPDQAVEFWYSTSRSVGGSRSPERISYFDERLRIVYRYDPEANLLYRLPASTETLAESDRFLEIFHGMLRGDTQLDAEFPGLLLQEQRRRQIEQDGRKVDEYELNFQAASRPNIDVQMTFVVDAQTRLPHTMTMNGGGAAAEFTFDYPDNGPADIYALGVPRDAQLVDRVPVGDMSRLLAASQAGRDRFDDFHAIVVRYHAADMSPGRGSRPFPLAFLVWKKGSRWRVEVATAAALLKDRADPNQTTRSWVQEACRQTFFVPRYICDGKAVYEADRETGRFQLHGTAHGSHHFPGDTNNVIPFASCYPVTLNAPNERTEEVLNLTPSDGPPDTVLVTSRVLHPRPNEIPLQRFWLDPARGYVVVRQDLLLADPAVEPKTTPRHQEMMDQWEQTPGGIWYPTRVRSGVADPDWYHFFLDFDADLPDSLFKPERRTMLTDRYPVGS